MLWSYDRSFHAGMSASTSAPGTPTPSSVAGSTTATPKAPKGGAADTRKKLQAAIKKGKLIEAERDELRLQVQQLSAALESSKEKHMHEAHAHGAASLPSASGPEGVARSSEGVDAQVNSDGGSRPGDGGSGKDISEAEKELEEAKERMRAELAAALSLPR